VSVSVVDLDCVIETVGELLSKGTVTVVKELLGVNEVVGVIEIGEVDADNVDVMVVVIDPYDGETRGLAVFVIGDCDKVLVGLSDMDVLADCTGLNVIIDDGELEGWTVLDIDDSGVKVDDARGLEDCSSD